MKEVLAMSLGAMSLGTSRGVMYVHSAPAALCPHVEWAVAGILGARVSFSWTPQPASPGTFRSEILWEGAAGTASRIASALRRWNLLRFEVTEDPVLAGDGARYSCTPQLGLFGATTNAHGDVLISENRLRSARDAAVRGEKSLADAVEELLGTAWDDELEVFRHAGEEAPGRWLHQVG
jgi:hypothetical protein